VPVSHHITHHEEKYREPKIFNYQEKTPLGTDLRTLTWALTLSACAFSPPQKSTTVSALKILQDIDVTLAYTLLALLKY
jgi:hypothetical protein